MAYTPSSDSKLTNTTSTSRPGHAAGNDKSYTPSSGAALGEVPTSTSTYNTAHSQTYSQQNLQSDSHQNNSSNMSNNTNLQQHGSTQQYDSSNQHKQTFQSDSNQQQFQNNSSGQSGNSNFQHGTSQNLNDSNQLQNTNNASHNSNLQSSGTNKPQESVNYEPTEQENNDDDDNKKNWKLGAGIGGGILAAAGAAAGGYYLNKHMKDKKKQEDEEAYQKNQAQSALGNSPAKMQANKPTTSSSAANTPGTALGSASFTSSANTPTNTAGYTQDNGASRSQGGSYGSNNGAPLGNQSLDHEVNQRKSVSGGQNTGSGPHSTLATNQDYKQVNPQATALGTVENGYDASRGGMNSSGVSQNHHKTATDLSSADHGGFDS